MTKLKPCPFCGGEDVLYYGQFDRIVICRGCGAQGAARADYEGAAKVWNKRQPDPQLVNALKKIERRLEGLIGDFYVFDKLVTIDELHGLKLGARQALADIEPDINSPNPLSEQRAKPDMKEDAT